MPFKTPLTFVSALDANPPEGPKLYFLVHEGKLLVNERAQLPYVESLTQLNIAVEAEEFLGELDGQLCVMARLAPRGAIPDGAQLVSLRTLLGQLRPELTSIAGRAVQIAEWERTHRFCGACGEPTERVPGQRAKRCPRCQLVAFPRVTPAIIVAVEREDQILLARGPHFPPGVHSCLAGFVDPGESAEEAVRREVFEEVGLRVDNLRYFDSQPWPFPHSLMLGFFAEYVSGEIRIDGQEIVSADFFRADALPMMFPGKVSISQWLIHDFLRRQRPRCPP
jgi:NAD+ diphosphatase